MAQTRITHGQAERVDAAASLFSHTFQDDPAIAYLFLNVSHEERVSFLESYFKRGIKAAVLNDSLITEIDDWKAAAVIVPPGASLEGFSTMLASGMLSVMWRMGISGCWRLLTDVAPQVDAAIKKAFKDQQPRYYYLYAIGTEHQHQRKGKEALLYPGPGAISPESEDQQTEFNRPRQGNHQAIPGNGAERRHAHLAGGIQ